MSNDPTPPQTGQDELRERLAELAHEQWSGWMRYLFGRSVAAENGNRLILEREVIHWTRQMATPYADLSEAEKDSDRKEADRVLAALRASVPAQELEIDAWNAENNGSNLRKTTFMRCEGRYPIQGRSEPFEVTYRCGRQHGHAGPCGIDDPPESAVPVVTTPEQGWQPIETAPEDRALLLWIPNRYPHVVVGSYWQVEELRWGWWAGASLVQPSHWMPLPAPPVVPPPETEVRCADCGQWVGVFKHEGKARCWECASKPVPVVPPPADTEQGAGEHKDLGAQSATAVDTACPVVPTPRKD